MTNFEFSNFIYDEITQDPKKLSLIIKVVDAIATHKVEELDRVHCRSWDAVTAAMQYIMASKKNGIKARKWEKFSLEMMYLHLTKIADIINADNPACETHKEFLQFVKKELGND